MLMPNVPQFKSGLRISARGAGGSIKPRVERGFASGTLGQQVLERILARGAGDRAGSQTAVARFAG